MSVMDKRLAWRFSPSPESPRSDTLARGQLSRQGNGVDHWFTWGRGANDQSGAAQRAGAVFRVAPTHPVARGRL